MDALQELQVYANRVGYLAGGYEYPVVAYRPVTRQVERRAHRSANVVEAEASVEQPVDQVDALVPRIALEAVEQAQRLEVGVRRHVVNVLFGTRCAGPKQFHLALDALEMTGTGERPGEF